MSRCDEAAASPAMVLGCAGGLTVLHLDKDFDVIAKLTGQPVERLKVT